MVDNVDDRVFVVPTAIPNSKGQIGPDEIRAAEGVGQQDHLGVTGLTKVYLDEDMHVIGHTIRGSEPLSDADLEKTKYIVTTIVPPHSGGKDKEAVSVVNIAVNGRDGKFHEAPVHYNNWFSGTGTSDFEPFLLPVDSHGVADFGDPKVRAQLSHAMLPALNAMGEQPLPPEAEKIPDRWKTGLQKPQPAAPKTGDPVSEAASRSEAALEHLYVRQSHRNDLETRIAAKERDLGVKPISFAEFDGRDELEMRDGAIVRLPLGGSSSRYGYEETQSDYLAFRQEMIKRAQETGHVPTQREQWEHLAEHASIGIAAAERFMSGNNDKQKQQQLDDMEREQNIIEGKKPSQSPAKKDGRDTPAQGQRRTPPAGQSLASAVPPPSFGQLVLAFIGSLLGFDAKAKRRDTHRESYKLTGDMDKARQQIGGDGKIKPHPGMSPPHHDDYSNKAPAGGPALVGQRNQR
jgi:hypothetical protein